MSRPGAATTTNALPLKTDVNGIVDYDAILSGGGGKVVHSKMADFREKDITTETFAPRPDAAKIAETVERTGAGMLLRTINVRSAK
jgi:hypothetical protein